jgi:hypothetical protein
MLLIADALTVVYLRPYLLANGFAESDVDRIVVWYDPSAISTRNDRAADADAGFDKMAISLSTWRHAHGFSDADAPTPEELAIRMFFEKGMLSPELTEAALAALAPDMMTKIKGAQQANSVGPLPPEVTQALSGEPPAESPEAPATPEEEPAEAGTPLEPTVENFPELFGPPTEGVENA